ncbi:SubName: Full=Uncharacterized protein {ECO:0000313/EMBL:CCA66949.1} [Serendipita indica DSM 11827]|nr:SubName: Full=Uncharacterized protein {ECO:0000313/EMBL:CCA66949.1} [Serendipita indica DSM 11827]
MSSPVPYRAYQSKRHSRNLSNTFTPPQSPPLAPVGSPKSPATPASNASSKRLSTHSPLADLASLDRSTPPPATPPSNNKALPLPSAPVTPVAIEILEIPPSPISESTVASPSPQVVEEPPQPVAVPESPSVPPKTVVTPPAPPVASPKEETPSPASPAPPKLASHSTFRHVPARASPLRPSASVLKSSYEGTPLSSRSTLTLGTPSRAASGVNPSSNLRPRPPGGLKVHDFSQSSSQPGSPVNGSSLTVHTARPAISSPLSSSSSFKIIQSIALCVTIKTGHFSSPSPSTGSVPLASGSSTSTIQAPRKSDTPNRTVSTGSAPYRHGFQPKLIDLHFPSQDSKQANTPTTSTPLQEKPPPNRRQSSFFDFDLSDLKGKNASDLWRNVLDSAASTRLPSLNAKGEIRQQEMAITPWQEDAAVPACPICLTTFNTLTNRKHHCRLCGKVVCSLPVKHPNRPELCSFLFVVDAKTGLIEEVSGDIVDYGVKRQVTPGGKSGSDALLAKKMAEEQEKYLKGVRICKECRPTLRRRQYGVEARTTPPFSKLYAVLLEIEKEIEEMLPQFQELVIHLSQEDDSNLHSAPNNNRVKQATNLRKHLLESFSQYDAIAKRIKSLKTPGPNSSQEKVQNAISNRATLFLQRNLFPLQSLPKPKKPTHAKNSSVTTLSLPSNLVDMSDQDAALAHTLQPLLEQEALLESFVEEANAQRKFEDAKTLKQNLKEIRQEIDRLLNGRDLPGNPASAKG